MDDERGDLRAKSAHPPHLRLVAAMYICLPFLFHFYLPLYILTFVAILI